MRIRHGLLGFLVFASSAQAETLYLLGGHIAQYEDVVLGENGQTELDTRQYGFAWRALPEQGAALGVSYWWSEAERSWARPAHLKREQWGAQLSVAQALGASDYSLGLYLSRADMDTRLEVAGCLSPCREAVESWSGSLILNRSALWGGLSLTPSLGFSYRHDTLQQVRELGSPLPSLTQSITEKSLGWSLELGLALAYDIELASASILTPYLNLNWSEPLTLETRGSESATLRPRNSTRAGISRSHGYGATHEDSLSGSAGMSWMWQDWLWDISASAILAPRHDTDPGTEWRAGLSYLF